MSTPTTEIELVARRHDLRVVREPHRTQAEQARRRAGDGQLRHGEGAGPGPGGSRPGRARGAGRGRGLHRDAARAARVRRRRGHRARPDAPAARPARRQRRARGAGDRAGDGARPAVHLLAVDLAHARRARRGVGRVAVPPRGVDEPAPRRRRRWTRSSRSGVLAAFGWSLWALVFGTAGEPGMVHPFTLAVSRGDAAGQIYLEVAAGVTTFLLAGRYFEARSKRRAGAALRALLELGAKDVAVLRPTSPGQTAVSSGSRSTGSPSATGSSCGPGRRSRRTGSSRRAARRSTPRC